MAQHQRFTPPRHFPSPLRHLFAALCILVLIPGCAQQAALWKANQTPSRYPAKLLEGAWFAVARTNFESVQGSIYEALLFQKDAPRKWSVTYRGWSNLFGKWFERRLPLGESESGHLVGSIFGDPPSPLYILATDPTNRCLLVATSNKRHFFVLSRDQFPDPRSISFLLEEARFHQLPVGELLFLQNI
jgi:lipocalin